MAIQSQPSRIPEPFAGSGTKNVIPATNATPSASQAASWASGFPPECSQPISAGGCPVPRNDVNGALNQLSQDFAFRQDGGIWEWSALADYDAQRVVRGSDGILYWSVQPSGPNVAAGAQDPTADSSHVYWASPKVPTMPAVDSSAAAASTQWVNSWYSSNVVPKDVYVDANNGDDNYDGYSVVTPKRTLSAVVNIFNTPGALIRRIHVIHVAQGTYTAPSDCGVSGTLIIYDFEAGSIVHGAFSVSGSSKEVHLGGTVKVSSGCIQVNGASWITIGSKYNPLNITFENVSTYAFLWARVNGFIGVLYDSGASTITFSGTCSASMGTAVAESFSYINVNNSGTGSITCSGSVTGTRYIADRFALIAAGSPTKFPGSANGWVGTFGAYY